jgi:hypothetical protein
VSLCYANGTFHADGVACEVCARQEEILRRARHDVRYLATEVAAAQSREIYDASWSLPEKERWKIERAWRAAVDEARETFSSVCAEIREIVV